jgi:hypothetical protein
MDKRIKREIEKEKIKARLRDHIFDTNMPKMSEKYNEKADTFSRGWDRLLEIISNNPNIDGRDAIIKKMKKLTKKNNVEVKKIEKEFHIILVEQDEKDEYPDIPWTPEEPRNIKPVEKLKSGKAGFLNLQLDLSCDKKELLQYCNDAIISAQEKVGKQGDELTEMKHKTFAELFKKYYIDENLSKEKAIEKVMIEFEEMDIKMSLSAINKIYLKRYKRDRRILDVRDLKEGG